jgi:hypothetical protein
MKIDMAPIKSSIFRDQKGAASSQGKFYLRRDLKRSVSINLAFPTLEHYVTLSANETVYNDWKVTTISHYSKIICFFRTFSA